MEEPCLAEVFIENDDKAELARFIFNENKHPGIVVIDTEFESIISMFMFYCDLYVTGVQLYNGMGEISALTDCRSDTISFLKTRMETALRVSPNLKICEEEPNNRGHQRYIFLADNCIFTKCVLIDTVLNTELTFDHHV